MKLDAISLTGAAVLAVTLFAGGPTASAAPTTGDMIFHQRCQACHVPGRSSPLGPNLAGVVGRKAASTSFNYSAALKGSGLTWTKANLETFLGGPARMVPGTKMVIAVPDVAQRKALIEYLAKLR
jgi:cytochrome c